MIKEKKSGKSFEGFNESGLIEAVYLFKRQMSRTANVFMHWALVLKGQKYYNLIEFGPHGVEYGNYESLHECARNMMGDHSKVYVWKVKRLRESTLFGISLPNLFKTNDGDPFNFKPVEYSFEELNKFILCLPLSYDLALVNCQVFSKILIFQIRRDKTWTLPQQHLPTILYHYTIESNLLLSVGYDYQYDV